MSRSLVESLVGALVLAVAIVVILVVFQSSDTQRVAGYQLTARFDNAEGLASGTDIRLAGIKIGTVASQRVDPETFQAAVVFNIDSGIALPADSRARVVPDGLLGGTFIEIEPGGAAESLAPGGAIENTRGAINVVELISHIVSLAVDATANKGAEAPAGR